MQAEQDSLELGKYLEILVRWWWVLLIVPVIFGTLAYYHFSNQPDQYRAATDVLVQEARSSLIGPAESGTNERLANTYARLATTRDLGRRVQEELAQAGSSWTQFPSIKASSNGSILRITAEGPEPEVARAVSAKLAELLILDIQTSQVEGIARLQVMAENQGISVSREVLQAQLSTIESLRIIEPAVTPGSPFAPNPTSNTMLGVILGLVMAGMIVFLLEYFNNNIRSVEHIEKLFGSYNMASSTIGVIFRWKSHEVGSTDLVVHDRPSSVYAEMFRQLRTGFQFVRAVHNTKTFLVTSSAPLEGKTTITANLAVVLAQGGSRVIMVDADLRRPSVHRIFNLPGPYSENNYRGFSSLLVDHHRPVDEELVDVGIPGLQVMASGRVPPNPADLLT